MTAYPSNLESVPTVRCPKCAAEMMRYERSGIIVDQCRDCRGIFLDRGELERLMDLELAERPGAGADPGRGADRRQPEPAPTGYRPERRDDDDDDERRPYPSNAPQRTSRKRSLFGELFEGFGD